jgi:ribonuclease HII
MGTGFPTFQYEQKFLDQGFALIAGVDEAGRGPLAGPVVAAAAILPEGFRNFGLRDSKLLSESMRDQLYSEILVSGILFGVGIVNHRVIDRINIYHATQLAMRKAISRLPIKPEVLLVDGMKISGVGMVQEKVVQGDRKVLSIAAASVIAKVTRDRIMRKFDLIYPGYGLAKHKGYPTKSHCECIGKMGLLPIHRRTFGPVLRVLEHGASTQKRESAREIY